MVMPGVTTRNPRVKRRLLGRRTALIVCHAISMAMTVVLPAPGSKLHGQPRERRIGFLVRLVQVFKELAYSAELGRNFGQPNYRLYRLDLTEEGADIVESMAAPVVQQPGRLGRNPPLTKIRQRPPAIDGVADAVDGLCQLVLLIFRCDLARSLIQVQLLLGAFALLRRGDRCDERDLAPPVEDAVGGLAALVKLPVLCWVFVG